MSQIKKTPLDLLDDIYSLACWMTGSEELSQKLVEKTYHFAKTKTGENELLRAFRESCVDLFGQQTDLCITNHPSCNSVQPEESLRLWATDIKLSVLLSEISGLKHRQIAKIVDKPVNTVRLWLYWGRKLLVNGSALKATA